jgi:CSLREA domain-containing protein
LLCLCVPGAHAAITVSTHADESTPGDGMCSLREAVAEANSPGTSTDCPGAATSGTTTVAVPAGTYKLAPGSGLSFTDGANVSLKGASSDPSQTVIDGSDDSTSRGHVLQVALMADVTLTGLTVRGGYTADGAAGADNGGGPGESGGAGQSGGGIENRGTVALSHVAITANQTGNGGKGGNGGGGGNGGNGGEGGNGAGIWNAGTLTGADSTITANTAGVGGTGGDGSSVAGNGGRGGAGGGIESDGLVTLTRATVSANHAGAGGDAGGPAGTGVPAPGGAGGGIDTSGFFAAYSSTVSENSAGAGGPGGNGGDGGGIAATGTGGTLTLANTTISGDTAGRGGDVTYAYPAAGNGGEGGGIFAGGGVAILGNDTIAGDAAGAGGTDLTGLGMGGAGGGGGGIEYASTSSMTLLTVTITQNTVGRPGAGGASAVGGGIEAAGANSSEASTLIAANSRPNCAGTVGDGGNNLHFPAFDPSCPGGNGDPKLGTLARNGGPTQTVALQTGSAAIDQVPAGAACPSGDQRGVARPQPAGGMCDIGAYEYAPPACVGVNVTTAHATPVTIQLACTDQAGAPLGYALDTGPAHGTLSGFDAATGIVTYTPAADYSGPDSFGFHAANGNGTAASQTVTLNVSKPSQLPQPPALSRLQIRPRKFFATAKRRGGRHKRKTGAMISYNDTQAATTTFTVLARRPGIATKRGCVKLRYKLTHAKPCTRYVVIGRFRHSDQAGANRLPFSSQLGRHRLAPGSYRLQALPVLGGQRGGTVAVSFKILP